MFGVSGLVAPLPTGSPVLMSPAGSPPDGGHVTNIFGSGLYKYKYKYKCVCVCIRVCVHGHIPKCFLPILRTFIKIEFGGVCYGQRI